MSGALVSAAGVNFWGLLCVATDDSTTPAIINATLTINQSAHTFSFTAPPGTGSAAIFQSTVGVGPGSAQGYGTDANNVAQPSYTTTFKVNVKTAAGLRVLAANAQAMPPFGETVEQDATFGWANPVNAMIRSRASSAGPSGLQFSVVDCAVGRGAQGTLGRLANINDYYPSSHGPWGPGGVGFGVTQPGHFCTGGRYFWGDTHPVEVALWLADGTKLAYAQGGGVGANISVATFASPVALTPGTKYCITCYDLYVHDGSHPDYPTFWFYAGTGTAGLIDMSLFMPYGGNETVPLGPFSVLCDFLGGSSPADVYGLGGYGGSTNSVPTNSNTYWYPIEPTLV